MILKELTIKQFGEIRHFDISLCKQVNVITVPDTNGIAKAIGLATNNKSLINSTKSFVVSENTRIVLKLEIADHLYSITVRGQPYGNKYICEATDCENNVAADASLLFRDMNICEEEESLIYYRYDPKNAFSKRLFHYKYPDKYYIFEDFQKETNGFGVTQTFRAYLNRFIRKYEACDCFADFYKTELRSDGRFILRSVNAPSFTTDLNELDRKLFDYACYIEVNRFWDGFADIRDMNHEKLPMLIDVGDMNENTDFHKLLVKSQKSDKQIIVMNRKNSNASI